MRLVELRMERFKSFREPTTFTFPREAGLYFMTGRNEVQPRLGANAAGKSTIWDALTWVAFDKTPKGLRAGDVKSWGAKGQTIVELVYEDDDGRGWLMRRTSGPNSWTLMAEDNQEPFDLAKSDDNLFLADLRLSFQTWVASVVMAQSEPMFLDLKPDAKAAMFGQLLDLDKWLERSKTAGQQADEVDSQCRALERKLADARGRLAASSDAGLKQRAEEWLAKQAHRLAELETLYKSRVAPRKSLLRALREAEALEAEERKDFVAGDWEADVKRLTKEWDAAKVFVLRSLSAVGQDAELIKELKQQAELLEHVDTCPTCKQEISPRVAQVLLDGIVVKLNALQATERKAKEIHDAAWDEAEKAEQALERAKKIAATRSAALTNAEEFTRKARRELELLDRDLDRLEDQAADLDEEVNPFADMLAEAGRNTIAIELVVEQLEGQLSALEEKRSHLQYWVKGFKQVRLTQMADALASLEIEVNSALVELGLLDWELRFAVDKVSKRGTVTKGFSVEVLSPESPEAVPWEAWSGGEAQRLRLATQMGLADLVRQRTGATIPMEVWDEPTQGINPQGLTDLLDALGERARREDRQVWVVDHHSLGYGAFTGQATIVRTGAGSGVFFAP